MLEQLSAGVSDPCMKASIPWVRCLSGDWKLGIKPRILRKLYFLQAKIEDVLTHRNSDCDLIWKQGQCVCNWLRWGHFGTWWCLQKKKYVGDTERTPWEDEELGWWSHKPRVRDCQQISCIQEDARQEFSTDFRRSMTQLTPCFLISRFQNCENKSQEAT